MHRLRGLKDAAAASYFRRGGDTAREIMMGAQAMAGEWVVRCENLTRSQLSCASGLTDDELGELIEYGALRPLTPRRGAPRFTLDSLAALKEAARLRRDFDLDLFAVALLLDYVTRIDVLERQVHSLQAQLPFHSAPAFREGPQPWREPHG
jgi:chaperone modulatory protein CbpM